jgi:hypothetical protein
MLLTSAANYLESAMTPSAFAEVARDTFRKKGGYKNKTNKGLDLEICQSLLGCSYEICSELWNLILPPAKADKDSHPKHLC